MQTSLQDAVAQSPSAVHLVADRGAPARAVPHARAGTSTPANDAGRIADMLKLVADRVPIQRRTVHAGDVVYGAGSPFVHLFVVHCGFVKIVNTSADGRNQVVALHFRGDWLGFDGIAIGQYGCDAVALDIGEVWALRYDALLRACIADPLLLATLHVEMSHAITRGRDSMLTRCTLPAVARVADFLRYWAESQRGRGLRSDQITLHMSRAEIGNYLGMTLESVSRALTGLVRSKVIHFAGSGRREIVIADVPALSEFIQLHSNPGAPHAQ